MCVSGRVRACEEKIAPEPAAAVRHALFAAHALERRGTPSLLAALLDDPEVDHDAVRRFGVHTGLWVPLVFHGNPIGVLAVHDKLGTEGERFTDEDVRRLTEKVYRLKM